MPLTINDTSASYECYMRNFNSSLDSPLASNRSIISRAKCTNLKPLEPAPLADNPPDNVSLRYNLTFLDEDTGELFFANEIFPLNSKSSLDLVQDSVFNQLNFVFQEGLDNITTILRPPHTIGSIGGKNFNTCGPRCSTLCRYSFATHSPSVDRLTIHKGFGGLTGPSTTMPTEMRTIQPNAKLLPAKFLSKEMRSTALYDSLIKEVWVFLLHQHIQEASLVGIT